MSLILRSLCQRSPFMLCRTIHASTALQRKDETLSKTKFQMAGFYKYGLLEDDLLSELDKDVEEAVRRLPEEIRLARIYRAITAQQCEVNHSILPKEQWSKFEDDHHYLRPYLEEVRKELEERAEWEATH